MKTKLYQFYDQDGEVAGLYLIDQEIDYKKIEGAYQEWYMCERDMEFADFIKEYYEINIERTYIDEEIYPN